MHMSCLRLSSAPAPWTSPPAGRKSSDSRNWACAPNPDPSLSENSHLGSSRIRPIAAELTHCALPSRPQRTGTRSAAPGDGCGLRGGPLVGPLTRESVRRGRAPSTPTFPRLEAVGDAASLLCIEERCCDSDAAGAAESSHPSFPTQLSSSPSPSPSHCAWADAAARAWDCSSPQEEGARGDTCSDYAQHVSRRRGLLLTSSAALAAVAASALIPGAAAGAVVAVAEQQQGSSVATQILRGLGIGDPDVYYPSFFLGDWDCKSTLISVDFPEGDDMADMRVANDARRRIGMPVTYQARFIEFGGNVIAERLYTTASLVEETVGKGVLVDSDWSPDKANVLTLTLKGGIKVRNLITKRSFELSAPGQFDVSEFSKQVLDNQVAVDGPPSVKASGNLTRFRWDPKSTTINEIEAFQRVAMYPVVGGAAAGRGDGGLTAMDVVSLGFGDKPTTVYKYLLHMERVRA